MSVDPNAADLRRRVAELRRLADHLAATPLREIADRAGPATWVSPRAEELRAQLDVDARRLRDSVDDLRDHARYLERQAEAVEAASIVLAAR